MKRDSKAFDNIALQVGKGVIIAAVYVLAALASEFFQLPNTDHPILHPQSGVALAAVLLFGYPALPGVFIGSVLSLILAGDAFLFSLFASIGNTLAVFLGSFFIFQYKEFSPNLKNYGSVFFLILFGVIISPVVAASINIAGMFFLDISPLETLPSIWAAEWTRHMLGTLVFSPFLLVWLGSPFPDVDLRRVTEGILIFAAVAGIELLLFLSRVDSETAYTISFLLIPLLIWASVRLDSHCSTILNFIAAGFFLFGITNLNDSLLNNSFTAFFPIVSVMSTMLVTSLIISASMSVLKKAQKNLSFLSTHDALTGLYNRLFFDTEIERLENSRLYPISIIMIDVDDLKGVNDTYGHSTGDQMLKDLADIFKKVFRQEDIISRIGGDEFVILLNNSDESVAKEAIARIQLQQENYNKEHPDLPLSVSIGVSVAQEGESLVEHLQLADKKMYEDKNGHQ
ncbi:MAG TPA: sensor domain-containing diguanylate cyclase [Desulfobacterales bacterium]|nr:sensor domain-containing diguanylate cyclase [Desulfobacterales bacterium]